ncbi:MAG TPA: rhomboid family intramembrane serine protease [Candidatus Acidoferrum sp.]|nr:rhomboid family intramembrane serine protease [Candidatus Acidoferrum sp.]
MNVVVYLAMCLSGVSWIDPSVPHAIRWGANFGPLTLSGEWWRLFTSMFVHFGLIHIGFNMVCFWDLGRALEFLMGRKAFVVTYVASGLAGSLASVAWDPWRVSAGASGAIFGIAGAFVSYLYFKKTPIDPAVVKQKLKSLGIFIAYNLFYGLRSGVDNSAHVGGLVAGLILGAVFPPMINALAAAGAAPAPPIDGVGAQESRRTRIPVTVALCVALLLALGATSLHAVDAAAVRYGKAVSAVRSRHLDQGIADMQQAVKIDPKLLYGQALLGQWELERNDPMAAVAPLEQALAMDAADVQIENNLSLAYLGVGRYEDAVKEMQNAFTHNQQRYGTGLFVEGIAADRLSALEAAAQSLNGALQTNPKLYEARDALAQVEIERGQVAEARESYATVLKEYPGDSVASGNIAILKRDGSVAPKASELIPVAIPYAKLLVKSKASPYYP